MGNVMKKNAIMVAIFEMFKLSMGVAKMVKIHTKMLI